MEIRAIRNITAPHTPTAILTGIEIDRAIATSKIIAAKSNKQGYNAIAEIMTNVGIITGAGITGILTPATHNTIETDGIATKILISVS
jgi:hypothetical protein